MRNDGYNSRDLPITAHLIHLNQDGRASWISGMEDDHLINTIRFFCRPLKEITAKLDDKVPERSTRAQHMYGTPEKVKPHQFQKLTVGTQAKIAPYVIEAVIRGLPAVRDILTEAFGREGKDTEAPTPDKRSMGALMTNRQRDALQEYGETNDLKRKLIARAKGEPFEPAEVNDEPIDMDDIING